MFLAVDVGNTNIKYGIFDGETLVCFMSAATDRKLTSDQRAAQLKTLLSLHDVRLSDITAAGISCVVADITASMCAGIRLLLGIETMIVGPGAGDGVCMEGTDAPALGADLVCAAAVVIDEYPKPCVVFTLGTATTAMAIGENGDILGGLIIPGAVTSLKALSREASALPSVDLSPPKSFFSSRTEEAMRAGTVYGTAAMLDGLAARFKEELGSCSFVLSGGLNHIFAPFIHFDCVLDDYIVLKGVLKIFQKNSDI